MSGEINHSRRLLGTMAKSVAAAEFVGISSAFVQCSKINPKDLPPIKLGTNTSLGPLKQIDAGLLNVRYAEAGPADGRAVILLHGWPYDIHSYFDVAPSLASAVPAITIASDFDGPAADGASNRNRFSGKYSTGFSRALVTTCPKRLLGRLPRL